MESVDQGLSAIKRRAIKITGTDHDYDALMELTKDAQIVLLGEATHGTHEFYAQRAKITQRLIREQGFDAIAVEADWPDAYEVNRHVAGIAHQNALQALDGFIRFPTWMWRNWDVLEFVKWLRVFNEDRKRRIGFYGLDLYSMHASIAAVLRYLDEVDPDAARRARTRYACFEHFSVDPQSYAFAVAFAGRESCEQAVVSQLVELRRAAAGYRQLYDGQLAADEYFYAEQNARLIINAEEYYRSMFQGRASSWNLRDGHMADTADALIAHLSRDHAPGKLVVWAHNSHVGDARETEMGHRGELNLGQLMRERHAERVVNVGFTTYTGTVTAADDWDSPGNRRKIQPALRGSYEALFHKFEIPAFLLLSNDCKEIDEMTAPQLERAIGVVYRPESERISHYFLASLPSQFDAVIHIDETRAVEPLDLSEHWQENEIPETYPFGV